MIFLEECLDELRLVVLPWVFLRAERKNGQIRRNEVVGFRQGRKALLWFYLAEWLRAVLGLIDGFDLIALSFEGFGLYKHHQVLSSELFDIILDQVRPKFLH